MFLAVFILLVGCQSDRGNQTEVTQTKTEESPTVHLTNEEAKNILKQLVPKAENIYGLFNPPGWLKNDKTKTIPGETVYALVIDENIKSVADLKKAVEEVFTKDVAETIFYSRYVTPGTDKDSRPLYKDYEGKLYVDADIGGHGWATKFLTDTARIKGQKDNAIEIEFDQTILDDPADPVTVKIEFVNGKWLLASPLVE